MDSTRAPDKPILRKINKYCWKKCNKVLEMNEVYVCNITDRTHLVCPKCASAYDDF